MIQLEKMAQEQRKIYDGLMEYDSVMTDWLNESEENKAQYKRNPLKTFLAVTGMGKNVFTDIMSPLADKEALLKQVEDEEDFTLDEAKTTYTNGWDIVNLATLDVINSVFSALFSNGIEVSVPLKSDDQTTVLKLKTVINTFKFTDLNGSLASMELQLENCTVSGVLNGDSIECVVGKIVITFNVELQKVSLETESGNSMELYLDLWADDVISDIDTDVESDHFVLKCVLDEILPQAFEKIIDQIPIKEPYKICTVDIDEKTQDKINWLIPDFASFSGSSVLDKNGVEKKELAVFAKTLDKDVADLNLNIEKQFADSKADGTMGVAERIVLGYILPACIASSLKKMEPPVEVPYMQYDENENCLKIDKTITEEESGAVINVKDFRVSSRESGFRLDFYVDGNWGAGMVTFDATAFIDIRLSFKNDGTDGGCLEVSVSNPTIDYDVDIPWWEWLIMAVLLFSLVGIIVDVILGIILGVAAGIIDSIMKALQENGIDGLPCTIKIPIQWNNLQFLEMETMDFSEGMHLSYSMQTVQTDEE